MVNNLVLLLEDILVSPASLVSPLQECTACLRADIPVCLEVTQVRLVDIPVRLVDILVRLARLLVNTPNQEAQRLEVQARSATKRARTRRTRKPARTRRTRRRAVPPQAQAAALTLRFNSQGPHTGRCPILVWEVILA